MEGSLIFFHHWSIVPNQSRARVLFLLAWKDVSARLQCMNTGALTPWQTFKAPIPTLVGHQSMHLDCSVCFLCICSSSFLGEKNRSQKCVLSKIDLQATAFLWNIIQQWRCCNPGEKTGGTSWSSLQKQVMIENHFCCLCWMITCGEGPNNSFETHEWCLFWGEWHFFKMN